jgi:DNA replicative helicase MCM subunit Mcm2 (Cdc46/Mcm family)
LARKFACETCKKVEPKLLMGTCLRDHPEMVKLVIGEDNKNGTVDTLNMTGSTTPFKTIDSKNLNELIVFKATIMQTADISNYYITKTFVCQSCAKETPKVCDDYRDIYDKDTIPNCDACESAPMKLDKQKCIIGNVRKVMLQEVNEESGTNPRRMEAQLIGKDVYDLVAGKDYKFEARVWSISYGKKENYNRFVLSVTRVRCLDDKTDMLPTPDELETYRNWDKKKVVQSLAPQLVYREDIQMAGIVSFLSGGRNEGVRGDFSSLFLGDPSTGKTEVLDALHSLDKKSFKISGRSSSAAGMVMGVDNLPDGTRMATFGPVVLAHEHFVCIDEGDKMNPTDQSMLHDVMESQMAYLNKVGINISQPTQTKIIMAGNPKGSRYDKEATIMANVGMPNSFLARFGYIFLVLDNFTRAQEEFKIDRIDFIAEHGLDKLIVKEGLLPKDDLIKYLNYAKSLKPKFEPNALGKLKDLYLNLKFREQEKGSIDIDSRSYHDIIRASYSFAKFRFSTVVEIEDVNNAWRLYLKALESFGMKTMGEFKEVQFATKDNTMQQFIDETVEDCAMNGMINIDSLKVKLMENKKYFSKINITEDIINDMIKTGKLLQTQAKGVYRYNG